MRFAGNRTMRSLRAFSVVLLLLCGKAAAVPHFRSPGVFAGVGYASPWYYSPYYFHPWYGTGFARGPAMGQVKLHAPSPGDEVFLDGAFAGTAHDLKSMWLAPGVYNLEVRPASGPAWTKRIYVLTGRTLRLDARPEGARK
jgi:hypothetical protein